jgi:hypothetical protein
MSVPSIPPPLEQFGQRPFSFYPPILNIEHNEWVYEKSTWSEMLVRNSKSGLEIWVPRLFLGEVSRIDEPVMIVGLVKELEYKAGSVWPHERRVIEMPRGGVGTPASERQAFTPPGRMSSLRLDSAAEGRIGKLIVGALVLGVLACFLVISVFRGRAGDRVHYEGIVQSSLGLNSADDYYSVVRKRGAPSSDAWMSEEGALQYRALHYPDLTIILMGTERNKEHYIGALNKDWKPVDSVQLPDGRNTGSMLRSLRRF